jgi:hypothetical protein
MKYLVPNKRSVKGEETPEKSYWQRFKQIILDATSLFYQHLVILAYSLPLKPPVHHRSIQTPHDTTITPVQRLIETTIRFNLSISLPINKVSLSVMIQVVLTRSKLLVANTIRSLFV